jgi:hypothetical protein
VASLETSRMSPMQADSASMSDGQMGVDRGDEHERITTPSRHLVDLQATIGPTKGARWAERSRTS